MQNNGSRARENKCERRSKQLINLLLTSQHVCSLQIHFPNHDEALPSRKVCLATLLKCANFANFTKCAKCAKCLDKLKENCLGRVQAVWKVIMTAECMEPGCLGRKTEKLDKP